MQESVSTPEGVPRLFDLVQCRDKALLPAFYYALRDTVVADDLEQVLPSANLDVIAARSSSPRDDPLLRYFFCSGWAHCLRTGPPLPPGRDAEGAAAEGGKD